MGYKLKEGETAALWLHSVAKKLNDRTSGVNYKPLIDEQGKPYIRGEIEGLSQVMECPKIEIQWSASTPPTISFIVVSDFASDKNEIPYFNRRYTVKPNGWFSVTAVHNRIMKRAGVIKTHKAKVERRRAHRDKIAADLTREGFKVSYYFGDMGFDHQIDGDGETFRINGKVEENELTIKLDLKVPFDRVKRTFDVIKALLNTIYGKENDFGIR